MEICSLSEEERKAIERINYIQDFIIENGQFNADVEEIHYFSTLLNLINKQEKTIDRIKEYIHQEIVSREEDIEDYLDDDKEKNKDYIGELKEEKQHWKDIERIIEGKNIEELYMNWWKYGLYE